jgi:hypothetical protein
MAGFGLLSFFFLFYSPLILNKWSTINMISHITPRNGMIAIALPGSRTVLAGGAGGGGGALRFVGVLASLLVICQNHS